MAVRPGKEPLALNLARKLLPTHASAAQFAASDCPMITPDAAASHD
jgi:hypothetical protein